MYTVTANVDSEKYGKGKLVARLTEPEFVEYANLSDSEKLQFLKDHHARFQLDVDQLEDQDVSDYKVERGGRSVPRASSSKAETASSSSNDGKPVRKMRVINNGRDSGWVDVTEENEDKYNKLMDNFDKANRRMDAAFERAFDAFRPSRFFEDFDDPFRLDYDSDSQSDSDNEDADKKNDDKKSEGK